MHTQSFLDALDAHRPLDAEEREHLRKMRAFVAEHADTWWQRSTALGHVTGSAWVLNSTRSHALLLHHKKLNLWVQPGGHLDDQDASPAMGALREALEETGIFNLQLARAAIFDVDIHTIPARLRKGNAGLDEPAHLHFDVRYLIIASDNHFTISNESLGAKWHLLADLATPTQERSIARMAEKSNRLDL